MCFICHRSAPIANGTYVRVSFGDSVEAVCDDCMSKADEGEDLDEMLDMTDDPCGQPMVFNLGDGSGSGQF